jgi:transposase-like protein
MDAILKEQAGQLANELAAQVTTLEDLNGLMRTMMKTALERMLNTEMDVHLHRRGPTEATDTPATGTSTTDVPDPAATAPKNRRNGHSKKTVGSDMGEFTLKPPAIATVRSSRN